MGSTVKIAFLADVGKAQKNVKDLGKTVENAGKSSAQSSAKISKSFDGVALAAVGLNSSADLASDALSSIDQIQNSARNEANRLARAQQDVEQAMVDGEQAAIDLRQATEDLKQAQIDSKQAAVDIEQAQIDATQAALDVTTAQQDYKDAIKEHGRASDEARQAAIDVKQAQADQKQATVDLTQAQADQRQSSIDSTQAQADSKQAAIDAKDATLNLADAQHAVDPSTVQQAMTMFEMYVPVLAAAGLATQALATSGVKASVAFVAQRGAALASAAASGVMSVAQWALNAAMSANPISGVILGIIALVAVIVILWKKSETFRSIVTAAWGAVWGAIKAVYNWIIDNIGKATEFIKDKFSGAVEGAKSKLNSLLETVKGLPGKIKNAFAGAGKWLLGIGQKIIQGLIDGINSKIGDVKSTLGNLTGNLTSWKGPASRDRRLLVGSGRLVIGGFLTGLEGEYQDVRSSLSRFTDSLAGTADVSGAIEVHRGGGTADGTTDRLVLELAGGTTGDQLLDAIWDALRRRIRIVGRGDVQIALGR